MAKHNGTQRRQRIALGIQASDKFFPFCWGKIFTFKNPDILKSCQIAKGVQILGSLGNLWLKIVLAFWVTIRSHPPLAKRCHPQLQNYSPWWVQDSGFLFALSRLGMVIFLPDSVHRYLHWRRAFMAETFCGQAKYTSQPDIDFVLVQLCFYLCLHQFAHQKDLFSFWSWKEMVISFLVGGFNPGEKNQIGSSPQVGEKYKTLKPPRRFGIGKSPSTSVFCEIRWFHAMIPWNSMKRRNMS